MPAGPRDVIEIPAGPPNVTDLPAGPVAAIPAPAAPIIATDLPAGNSSRPVDDWLLCELTDEETEDNSSDCELAEDAED